MGDTTQLWASYGPASPTHSLTQSPPQSQSPTNPNGGALGAPEGENVVPAIEVLVRAFVAAGATVAATKDYHTCELRPCDTATQPNSLMTLQLRAPPRQVWSCLLHLGGRRLPPTLRSGKPTLPHLPSCLSPLFRHRPTISPPSSQHPAAPIRSRPRGPMARASSHALQLAWLLQ